MDDILIYSVVISFLAIVLGALYFAKSKNSQQDREKNRRRAAVPTRNEDGTIAANDQMAVGPRGRRGGPRMQRRAQVQPIEEPDDDVVNEDNEEENASAKIDGKIGKKKMQKLQDKADKKANREAELQLREEEKKKKELEDADREKAAIKEKEEQEKLDEEEKKLKEEKERKEEEEYRKLAASFIVDEEGYDKSSCIDGEDQENQLQVFIQYIKDAKTVVLEDLAAHFKMKAQDTIDRVTQLLEQGHITGVMDDRGKFIYISQDELESIAKFIKQRGRVSIAELAENSNKLISLNSS